MTKRLRVVTGLTLLVLLALVSACAKDSLTTKEIKALARTPESWTVYRDESSGIAFRYPPSWSVAPETLTPYLSDPKEIVSLGTGPLTYIERDCAHVPTGALERVRSTDGFLSLQVRRPGSPLGSNPRPKVFTPASGFPARNTEIPDARATLRTSRARWVPFHDAGRALYAIVAVGRAARSERQAEPWQILNSLTVQPA